jgi:hypothetical protein
MEANSLNVTRDADLLSELVEALRMIRRHRRHHLKKSGQQPSSSIRQVLNWQTSASSPAAKSL